MATKMDLVKKIATVPALGLAANKFTPGIFEWTKNTVNWILNNEYLAKSVIENNPLFEQLTIGTVWSMLALPMVTNDILKSFPILERHKWIRYATNSIAAWVAYIWWTAASPYILWWAAAYHLGKPIFDRLLWWAYWFVWWGLKWAWKWALHWIKWNQFQWTWWNRINPNIS